MLPEFSLFKESLIYSPWAFFPLRVWTQEIILKFPLGILKSTFLKAKAHTDGHSHLNTQSEHSHLSLSLQSALCFPKFYHY